MSSSSSSSSQMNNQDSDSSAVKFIASEKFEGSKDGYAFKTGELGVGYYILEEANQTTDDKNDDKATLKKESKEIDSVTNFHMEKEFFDTKELQNSLSALSVEAATTDQSKYECNIMTFHAL